MHALIILVVFVVTPFVADYVGSPLLCWGGAVLVIAYQTWCLTLRKGPREIEEEKRRVEEARRRVEQIKEEAARSFLQGGKKSPRPVVAKDVNSMTEEELALAARKIVEELKRKKEGGGAPPTQNAA